MNLALLVIAAAAAVSPPRALAALPPDDDRVPVAALGALVALALTSVLAAVAEPIADAVDLATPTLRMAAGAVLAAQGIAAMSLRLPQPEPRLPGRRAAFVPVAFPTLLTPALGLLAVSASLDHGTATTVAVLAGALAAVPALAYAVARPPATAMRGMAALLGAVLVAAGIGLIFDGIFDI